MMMMKMMNCFCCIVDWWNRGHYQRSSPWRISDTLQTRFELDLSLRWMKLCSSDNQYTTTPFWSKFWPNYFLLSTITFLLPEYTEVCFVWHRDVISICLFITFLCLEELAVVFSEKFFILFFKKIYTKWNPNSSYKNNKIYTNYLNIIVYISLQTSVEVSKFLQLVEKDCNL